jgi:hypothetical protein
MKFLFGFLLGLFAGISRELWWPWALRLVDWITTLWVK